MSEDNGDTEEREVEFEHPLPREEIAEHFQALTDGLENGETITLSVGDEDAEFTPPESLVFEAEYEEEGNEREVELELKWTVQQDEIEIGSE
jgi:amphi-Trp domain-containing protein